MHPLTRSLAALLIVGTVLLPRPANADTIVITEGSLVADEQIATFHLEGGSRLVIDASGGHLSNRLDPASNCDGTPELCGPGVQVPLVAAYGDSDLQGTATWDGRTFPLGMQTLTQGSVGLNFDGAFIAPAFTGVERVTVSAPFTFSGTIHEPIQEGMPTLFAFLAGRGTATIDLSWNPNFGGAWDFQGGVYRFETSDPVPEPATLILVGSGIAGIVAARRRRREL